mmetsp:Transcript_3463/g.5203  ORF Transcript_3463/g.5203 Transcript_3463/m.5203 type:complete len:83 (+) Transcript_3463:2357-2605(+)
MAALKEAATSMDSKTSKAFLTVEDVDSDNNNLTFQKNLSMIESIQLTKFMGPSTDNPSMESSQQVAKCERSPKKMQLSSRVS